jgi:outer membrane protein TolC
MFRKYLCGVLGALTLATTQLLGGSGAPPSLLERLLEEARFANPDLKAARAHWEAATKRPSQEGSLPDPRVSVRNFGVGRPASGLNVSNFAFVSLGASQEIPFPGKLGLRRNIAVEAARVEEQRYRQLELDVLAQVKLHYYEYAYQQRALETVADDRELFQQFLKIAEARYSVGKGIQQDVLQAQIRLTALREREEVFQQRSESAVAAINSLLNRSPDESVGLPEELERSPFPEELGELYREAQQSSPRLRAQEHQVSQRAASLELSRKEYRPDFKVGFEWQRTGSLFRDYYVASFEAKVPLYFWRKQRLGVEEAASSLVSARHQYRAQQQDLLFRIKDHYLMARSAERLVSLYKTAIVPQATLTLESAISAYQVGEVDFLTLIDAASRLLDYELEYYKQLTAYQQALAKMEPHVGKELIQ